MKLDVLVSLKGLYGLMFSGNKILNYSMKNEFMILDLEYPYMLDTSKPIEQSGQVKVYYEFGM